MPSHSEKQARTMSAIAHGWKPKGSAAGIPVTVAKEFHAADAGKKYGSHHTKKAAGGALKVAYALKRERAAGGGVFEGPILSTVPGRTDLHETAVGSGSYILPAETVSHLGQSNTVAGLAKLKQMGAGGLKRLVHAAPGATAIARKHRAKGGAATMRDHQNLGKPTDVVLAGGEYALTPKEVAEIGNGDVELGHRLLDHWVMHNRKGHIETLRKLKEPAKD